MLVLRLVSRGGPAIGAAACGRARAHHRHAAALLPQPRAPAQWLVARPRESARAAGEHDGIVSDLGRAVGSERVSAPRIVARGLYLAVLFTPLLLASPLALVSEAWQQTLLRLLVYTLSLAGPCAMKLGQWASTRPDILPWSMCEALRELHERTRTHSLEETTRACEAAFGAPLSSIFATVSEEPVGSGCIAQVHTARLLDGRPVAIKVLHPEAAQTSALDLALIRIAVGCVETIAPLFVRGVRWLSLREAAAQFELFMVRQLDLTVEAANLSRFADNFASEPLFYGPTLLGSGGDNSATVAVRFPQPVKGLVARGVLVETLAEGRSLSALLANGADGGAVGGGRDVLDEPRRHRLARAGLRAFLQMMLVHNFVHADLHPGNIFCHFTEQPSVLDAMNGAPHADRLRAMVAALTHSAWLMGQAVWAGRWRAPGEHMTLTFIDAGLVVELQRRDRLNFLRLFSAIANGDGMRAGALMIEHARESDCDDPEAFKRKINAVVQRTHASRLGEFTLSRLDVGRVLLDVLSAVRAHRVLIEANFTTLISSIVILEGLGRQLDPDLDLLMMAIPLLARIAVTEAFHTVADAVTGEGGDANEG